MERRGRLPGASARSDKQNTFNAFCGTTNPAEQRILQNNESCRTANPAEQRILQNNESCRTTNPADQRINPAEQRVMQNNKSCRITTSAEQLILQSNGWIAGAGCGPSARNYNKNTLNAICGTTSHAEQRILRNNESCRTENPAEQRVERRGRLQAFGPEQ